MDTPNFDLTMSALMLSASIGLLVQSTKAVNQLNDFILKKNPYLKILRQSKY